MSKTKQVFKQHEGCNVLHRTSDGTHFFKDHHAAAHARTLDDKRVDVCHRADEAGEVSETKTAAKKVNANKKAKTAKVAKTPAVKELNPMQQAKADIEAVGAMESAEEINAFLEGKTAKTVLTAGEERIAVLNTEKE